VVHYFKGFSSQSLDPFLVLTVSRQDITVGVHRIVSYSPHGSQEAEREEGINVPIFPSRAHLQLTSFN
jgi:hypothetical protein